jgi:hypothetical protein
MGLGFFGALGGLLGGWLLTSLLDLGVESVSSARSWSRWSGR